MLQNKKLSLVFSKRTLQVLMIAVLAFAAFAFCYYNDNKYTTNTKQASYGILDLSAGELSESEYYYLIEGWEIYRNRLLTPEDFADGHEMVDEYVFIGQYGGLEGVFKGVEAQNPHGDATYRLSIVLPEEKQYYTLELPEIFSSYKLYINNELVGELGTTGSEDFQAEVGTGSVSFSASGLVQIVIAVSDYSHFYSGLVYPPVFGAREVVENLLQYKLAFRYIITVLAVAVAIMTFAMWLILRKLKHDKTISILHVLLLLCFTVYIGYPIILSLTTVNEVWYFFEILSYPLFLLLIILIQQLNSDKKAIDYLMNLLGFGVCIYIIIERILFKSNFTLMLVYSKILTVYILSAAVYLLYRSVSRLYQKKNYSLSLLIPAVVFGVSLIADRVYPLYEPIIFGWFSEISGLVYVVSICSILIRQIVISINKRYQLEAEVNNVLVLLDVQKKYFPMILEKEEKLRKALHDFRHHVAIMSQFSENKQYEELETYLYNLKASSHLSSKLTFCNHLIIDTVLRMYHDIAFDSGIEFNVEVQLLQSVTISDIDISSVLSNLLENGIEATNKLSQDKRKIDIQIKSINDYFSIIVSNTFDGNYLYKDNRWISSKENNRFGLGLSSVETICEKHHGFALFEPKNDVFYSTIVIPMR